ncbi:MAG: imidazole glycerol phosphate synthase subunit HisH [Flammeovirgaceae bacterium]|nr:MAG: imidazole glycerol phosphate synthase subunit HisH [Flammeovirgaceae bacterium]
MKTAIIKYNAGNIQSVAYALERLGASFIITDIPEEIASADNVIFPGVGQAQTTMAYLRKQNLDKLIRKLNQPVLGICLGMQLLCGFSEEGNTPCLGIFDETVKRFAPDAQHKVPHMGWNQVEFKTNGIGLFMQPANFYFVHSYYVPVNKYTIAQCHYGEPFSAMMRKDNFLAVQFHPEKSGQAGEHVLRYFLQSF